MLTPHRVYVGTIGEGLWRSTDSGATFTRASDGMFVECHVRSLAVHPRDPHTLYLGNEHGLFRSMDGADNWSRIDSPLNDWQIWSIVVLPRNPDILVVGTCPPRLFHSADGGRTWTEPAAGMRQDCPRIMHNRVTTLVADGVNPESIWAGVEIDGLYRSRDEGRTWQKLNARGLSSQDIHAIAVVPPANGAPKRLLAATNNDLNLSLDDGESWQPLRVGQSLPWSYCRGLAQKWGRPEEVFLGNGNGPPGSEGVIARSTDGGQTWQPASMPKANSTLWNFAVHAADPELIYASSVSGEVYRSTTGGFAWEKVPREFGEIRALAWTP